MTIKRKSREKQTEKELFGGKTLGEMMADGAEELLAEIRANDGKLPEKFTVRRLSVDATSPAYTPQKIKETRKILRASQAIFAKFLGVSTATVRAWEQGLNRPINSAGRMMDEIRHNPEYFQGRLLAMLANKTTASRPGSATGKRSKARQSPAR